MAGIVNYIKQYGKVTFEEAAFNDVDNLVMAELSYVLFEEYYPKETGVPKKFTIADVAGRLPELTEKTLSEMPMIYSMALEVLAAMGEAPRYRDMVISNYVNHVDVDADEQFSAITIRMNRKQIYVAFRGTDDTLVGWKEDFQLSYKTPIPSQEEAKEYLDHAISRLFFGEVYVGGHSKGGNLAVFAGIYCKERIQKKIVRVYNNDGPGFLSKMMARPEYQAMLPRIKTFVPQSSVIGMLFDHEEEYTVVQSDQVGIMQHAACSWQVIGNAFVTLDKTTKGSELLDRTMKNWLECIDEKTRETFVEALYKLLIESGFETAHEVVEVKPGAILNMVKALSGLEEEERKVLIKNMHALFAEGGRTLKKIRQFY